MTPTTRVLIAGGGTGGHLMPALALAAALREADPSVEPVLVGAERGVEASILPQRPLRFHLLPAEPIYRRTWWRNIRWPALAARLWSRCGAVLDAEDPTLVIGTGGYAAGPILLRAALRRIPVALQEQNAFPGVTTRWLARWAKQVYLGFPEAERHLRAGKHTLVFVTGNPITPPPEPPPDSQKARERLGILPGAPVLLVMGGSQGAGSINAALGALLERDGLAATALLWSTGASTWERYANFNDPPLRQVRAFWDPIADAYAAADLVVSRAGAMSTAELCAWGLPSILVPLAAAARHHQLENARALASVGAAVLLEEHELTPERLLRHVSDLLASPARLDEMSRLARARGRPQAAREIISRLRALMS